MYLFLIQYRARFEKKGGRSSPIIRRKLRPHFNDDDKCETENRIQRFEFESKQLENIQFYSIFVCDLIDFSLFSSNWYSFSRSVYMNLVIWTQNEVN